MDAIIRIPDLFKKVVELEQPGIAITDHGVLAGIYEGYKEYKKYKSDGKLIKFIPGSEIYYCDDLSDPKSKRRHLVVLAQNEEGYRNLLQINAIGFKNSVSVMGRQFPRVDMAILKKHKEGLFINSACGGSPFAAAIFEKNIIKARGHAASFQDIFGDKFHIELQPHELQRGDFNQSFLNDQLKYIADDLKINMIATCDSHYLTGKHEKYHDMILAIGSKRSLEDPTRHRYATYQPCLICAGTGEFPVDSKKECYMCGGSKYDSIKPCPEFYLKDSDNIAAYFSKKFDREAARSMISNTLKIADQCEYPDYMEPKGHRLPTFPWKEEADAPEFKTWADDKTALASLKEDASYLRFRVKKAFDTYTASFTKEKKTLYWDRCKKELEILEVRSFSSYMLIVADYIRWARDNGITVGPGRGSVGGSLVAFLLEIHRADPIKFGLIFERFQNREKKSLPDIDCDFAPSGREKVIQYCRDKYGDDKVAFVSNILRLTPKLVIKDVARSLVIGGDKSTAFKIANDVTASIPDLIIDGEKRIKVDTMDKAMVASEKLRKFIKDYPVIMDYANALIGIPRGFATHAAGVIISDIPLAECVPLRRDNTGAMSVQYDKDTCEENGLVKMDFLGLETLDVIDETISLSEGVGIKLARPDDLLDGDPKAYKMIHLGHTTGIFQLNGSMTPLCKAMLPKSIEDIAAISAIGRPSVSKSDRVEFINRRFGKSKIVYPHPCLEPVFKHTYGIPVYEEDLLKLAQIVAGWDLSEADGLRKLTKLKEKGAILAEELKIKFVTDSMKHSKISRADGEEIWRKVVEPFAGYGFNLSHAIMYSMISYQTAYYKANAVGPFICANLNTQTRGNKKERAENIDALKKEAKLFKISIQSCDINLSKQYYSMKDRSTIVTGLGAIKGIGERALNAIIANQPYRSFQDFLHRTPGNLVNKSVIAALSLSGAFDSLGLSRKYIHENFMDIRKELQAYAKKNGEEFIIELEEEVDVPLEAGDEGYVELADEMNDDSSGDIDSEAPKTKVVIQKKLKKAYVLSPEKLSEFVPKTNELSTIEFSLKEKLDGEKLTLGEYISGDIKSMYPGFFIEGRYAQSYVQLQSLVENLNFPTEGTIGSIREIIINKEGKNKGKIMGKLSLENLRGESVDVAIWADQYEKLKRILKVGLPIRGMFKVNEFNGGKSLVMVNLEAYYKKVGES
jgi:DNA polymerase-3 subunit alpha